MYKRISIVKIKGGISISWKSVIIKKSEKIFLKQNQLCVITNEKEALFNLKDINCIILENNYTYITTQILAKLVMNNIFIIICDAKYDPVGITLSLNQHWQPLTVFEKQINMKEHFKLELRTLIIEYKIKNTLIVMKTLKCKDKSISMIEHFAKTITLGDKTNRKGLTAKLFFRELYGSNFIRFSDNGINNALNYGYKILMSAISRTISKYGLNNYLGIFHIGKTNPFNLACDFLEPLRPLVDYWVTKHIDTIDNHISYNHRLELINGLLPTCTCGGKMNWNEFNRIFQTEKDCLKYIAKLKVIKCIRCVSFNLNTYDLKRIRCLKCHQTFSILTSTIFSRSKIPLTSWFYLIFRWINTKHGIPSTDVAKELGVTLKTAWRMTHKIRTRIAKQKPQFIVEGTVQIDEMYLSHMGFKKQGRSLMNKTLIVGIYEKTTNNLIVKVLKNANSKNLLNFAKKYISSKCHVYTDSWKGYCYFKSIFPNHKIVKHQDGYVSKNGVNTNQIESVWKHIRRTFKTHIKVAKHHVHLYAKEAAYKFNKKLSFETVMLCFI